MNRLFFIIACLIIGVSTIAAHEVNKYKYFCLDVDENPYGIEKRFLDEFQKQGFFICNSDYYENLDASQKALTLFAEYDFYINHHGDSSLTIVLKNAADAVVWHNTGYGCTFLSATGDIKKCTKQIMRSFSRLKYKFNESAISTPSINHPFTSWTEDSVMSYISTHRVSPVEGIYKDYSNDGNAYKLAIVKNDGKYYGFIIEADNELWENGETKLILNHIEGNAYDAEYYDATHKKLNALAELKGNRLLEFSVPKAGGVGAIQFLKIYPSSGKESAISTGSYDQCKATGSGVLISDNIIITNYHVIENSEKVEAIVNINGIPETFSARVLCTDKTNDLAIVCIKDEKFNSPGNAPFQILPNTVDVGTSVFAMGFPFTTFLGDEVKITDGIISSKSGYEGDIVTYQISVPIQPGNSGGPLFDRNGNLVGITNAGIDKSIAENVGYAIKTPYVLNIIDSAPINISLPKGNNLKGTELPELIKALKPYVVYVKIY